MKYYFLFFSTLFATFLFSCKDDDDDTLIYEYHAHIHHPDTLARNIGDTLEIEVEFESHTGQPVHHINVRIFRKSDNTVVYNKPDEAHIHETSGAYTYEDHFVLSAANGLTAGDWILEATVWGESDGQEETSEQVEFHIND
jgi:hypothetical protein